MRYTFNSWNLISKIIDVLFITLIPLITLPARKQPENRNVWIIAAVFALSVIAYGADFALYPVPLWVTLILMLAMGFAFMQCFCTGTMAVKTVMISAAVSSCMLVHYISGIILFHYGYELFSLPMTFLPIVFYVPIGIFLAYFSYRSFSKLPVRYVAGTSVIMPLLTVCSSFVVSDDYQKLSARLQLGTCILILGIVLFIYYIFFAIIREYEHRLDNELIIQNMRSQQQHLSELQNAFEKTRKLRHEQKNRIFYVESLLEQNRLSDLRDYLHELYKSTSGEELLITGKSAIDAVLNQKQATARLKGIPLQVQFSLPNEYSINEYKLCAVISNLLDNAIEASDSVEDPLIAIIVRETGKYLHIITSNRVSENINETNPQLITTKKKDLHGLGIPVIRSVVDEYNGMLEYHMENDMFVISLMLQN